MKSSIITLRKELRTIFRDKKILISLLSTPFLAAIMVFVYAFINTSFSIGTEDIGIDFETTSMEKALLLDSGVNFINYESKEEMEDAYKDGLVVGYMHYDEEKDKYFIYADSSEDGIMAQTVMQSYFQMVNSIKINEVMQNNGVLANLESVDFELVELEGTDFFSAIIFSAIWMMLITGMCLVSTSVATSAMASEKENGTLETILTFPIKKSDLVLGKFLSCFILTVLSSLLGYFMVCVSFYFCIYVLQSYDFTLNFGQLVLGALPCIATSLIISMLALLININAKTFREAQSKSGLLNFVSYYPMLTGLGGLTISGLFIYLVPVASFSEYLMKVFTGKFDYVALLLLCVSDVIYSVILFKIMLMRFKEEKILF